ncbi:terminase large subunit [Nitratiruptor tergarcus]|nr:terminase large subunit [Nitratiruptor tergarcus]
MSHKPVIEYKLIDYQVRFLQAKQKITALIGGTGCGKTFLLPIAIFYKALEHFGSSGTPMEIIVLAPTHKMLLRNPLKYIRQRFDELGIPYTLNKSEMTITFSYGVIYLISAESYESMQGIHASLIVMDEAGLMAKPVFDTALQRLAFHSGQLLILSTPYGSNHWLKSEVYDAWLEGDSNIFVVNPQSSDNPFYPLSEIERARTMLPKWKYEMFFEAKFTKPAGLIFEEVTYIPRFQLPPNCIYFRGLDFGFNNPNAVVQLALDPNNNDTVYVVGEWKKSQTNIDDLEAVLKKGYGTIYADPAGKDALETLKRRGLPMSVAKKDVLAGISMLDAMFRSKKLLVFDDLYQLQDELSTYTWQVDRNEQLTDKPAKNNDHLIDALRYAVFTYEGGYLAAKFIDAMIGLNYKDSFFW